MSRMILTIALAGVLGACSAAAQTGPELTPAPAPLAAEADLQGGPLDPQASLEAHVAALHCDIRVRDTANGVELEALAHSDAPAMGVYEFTITKADRGGSSDIMQSGEFALDAGQSMSLGLSEISIDRGGSFHAELVLSDEAGVICREEVRS